MTLSTTQTWYANFTHEGDYAENDVQLECLNGFIPPTSVKPVWKNGCGASEGVRMSAQIRGHSYMEFTYVWNFFIPSPLPNFVSEIQQRMQAASDRKSVH